MTSKIVKLVSFIGLCVVASNADMDISKVSSAINKFSATFSKELDSGSGKSTVCSPLSAEVLLALVALGAKGTTREEILSVVNIPDADAIRSGFGDISTSLKAVKGVTFKIANKVYLKDGPEKLNETFSGDAVNVFNAEVEKINFGNSSFAASTINGWVEKNTNNKIKDLIRPDALGEQTALVLVNAIYFKGSWKHKFPVSATRDEPFHVTASKTVQVPFMKIEKSFKYGQSKELNAQLLELPYEGEEASLLVVLPNDVDGLSGVLNKLAAGEVYLAGATREMYSTKVNVALPKFKIETEIDLKDLLRKLGVKELFSERNSDLGGLLEPQRQLFVSDAVQKAFIEVNEEGAEAAAASGMKILLFSMPRPAPRFVADRPFFYSLLIGNTVVFSGCYRHEQ